MASRTKSQVILFLEAWRDPESSGDSNTEAMYGREDFLKKKLAHQ